MTSRTQARARAEFALAIASAALFLGVVLRPDWIEILFGMDPDAGTGMLEWAIAGIPFALALLSGVLAVGDRRRVRDVSGLQGNVGRSQG